MEDRKVTAVLEHPTSEAQELPEDELVEDLPPYQIALLQMFMED